MRKTTSSKHRDSLKLLFGDRDVLRKVAKIRNFLKIPEDMYSLESEKDKGALYEKWIADLVAIPDEKNFNSIKKVQNNLKEKKTSLKMANEQVGLLDKNHPINYLHNSIQEIISECNLPKSYETNIYTYIMYGEMSWMTPQTFGVKIDLKKEGGVTLNIYHKLTDKDLIEIKNAVNKFFGKGLPPAIKPIKDIDTKLATERYHRDRKYVDHVTGKKVTMSAREIVENVRADTSKKIKPDDVYGIPRELNNIRKKRFTKSGTK